MYNHEIKYLIIKCNGKDFYQVHIQTDEELVSHLRAAFSNTNHTVISVVNVGKFTSE